MKTLEFETDLTGEPNLKLPPEAAAVLPDKGKATIILCIDKDPEYKTWKDAAYAHFLKDDSEEDNIYEKYC